jgi:hypothetical protein
LKENERESMKLHILINDFNNLLFVYVILPRKKNCASFFSAYSYESNSAKKCGKRNPEQLIGKYKRRQKKIFFFLGSDNISLKWAKKENVLKELKM